MIDSTPHPRAPCFKTANDGPARVQLTYIGCAVIATIVVSSLVTPGCASDHGAESALTGAVIGERAIDDASSSGLCGDDNPLVGTSAEDRALIGRGLLAPPSAQSPDVQRGRARLTAFETQVRDLALDATAREHVMALNRYYQALTAIVDEVDPSFNERFANARAQLTTTMPLTGPLTDDEWPRLIDSWSSATPRKLGLAAQKDTFEIDLLIERAVVDARRRHKSKAQNPPTRHELAAAILDRLARGSPGNSKASPLVVDEKTRLKLASTLGSRCADARASTNTFLQVLAIEQSSMQGREGAFTDDVKRLKLMPVPDGFTFTFAPRNTDSGDGYTGTLIGKKNGDAPGARISIDQTGNVDDAGTPCAMPRIDKKAFAPLFSSKEERQLARFLENGAFVDDGAANASGRAVFSRAVDAYYGQRGSDEGPGAFHRLAAALAQILRHQSPKLDETGRREAVVPFVPRLNRVARALTPTEARDLAVLISGDPNETVAGAIRLLALLDMLKGVPHSGSPTAVWREQSTVVAATRVHAPAFALEYESEARAKVCKALATEAGRLKDVVKDVAAEGGDVASQRQRLHEILVSNAPFIVVSTKTAVDEGGNLSIDAQIDDGAVILAGHHVRISRDGIDVIVDRCGDAAAEE